MLQEGIGWFGSGCYLDLTVVAPQQPTEQPTATQTPEQPTATRIPQPTQQNIPSEIPGQTKHILKLITIRNSEDPESKAKVINTNLVYTLANPIPWQLNSLQPNQQQEIRIIYIILSDGITTKEFTTSIQLRKGTKFTALSYKTLPISCKQQMT